MTACDEDPRKAIRFGLQTKFLVGILLLEAILMAAIILVVEHQMRSSILDEFLKRGLSVTKNLAAVNIDFVATYNYVKIEQNLERVVNENELLYATVMFFDSEIAGYKGREDIKDQILTGPLHRRTLEIEDTVIQYEQFQGEDFCDIAVPIFLKGENWGTVRAGFSLTNMHAAMVKTRKMLLAIGGIGLFFGYLASILLARRITGPIGHLVECVKAISSGKYAQLTEASAHTDLEITQGALDRFSFFRLGKSKLARRLFPQTKVWRVPTERSDELGVLARAFMQMSKQLKQTHEQLEEHARSLEDKVAARTEALQREIRDRVAAEFALQKANEHLQCLVNLDGLTQIANRRRFDDTLAKEWQRMSRELHPLTLVLCDVDFFKLYNDTYGHQAGDECLRRIAQALSQVIRRPADLVARYGGEEFAAILPNTDVKGAVAMVEAVRETVEQLRIPHAQSQVSEWITLSVGISSVVPDALSSAVELVGRADRALYNAKAEGRDRYCVSSQPCRDSERVQISVC